MNLSELKEKIDGRAAEAARQRGRAVAWALDVADKLRRPNLDLAAACELTEATGMIAYYTGFLTAWNRGRVMLDGTPSMTVCAEGLVGAAVTNMARYARAFSMPNGEGNGHPKSESRAAFDNQRDRGALDAWAQLLDAASAALVAEGKPVNPIEVRL